MSPLNQDDIKRVSQSVVNGLQESLVTKQDLVDGLDSLRDNLRQDFSELQSSVDRYLEHSETWHDEFRVLQARHVNAVHILDARGVIKEKKTRLT